MIFSSLLESVTARTAATIEAIHGYVNLFYPAGTEGRASFFAPGPGTPTQDVVLENALKGLARDRAQPDPLLPDAEDDPLLDVERGQDVLRRLRQLTKLTEGHENDTETALVRRNRLGDDVRQARKDVEAFIRRLHKTTPGELKKYGLRPLITQHRVRNDEAAPAPKAKVKSGKGK